MNAARVLPVFSAAFIILYVVAMDYNLALFTYHPVIGELDFLTVPPKRGPAMYWYGWIATAFLGAVVLAAAALALPPRLAARIAPALSWVVPVGAMLVVVFILRGYFIR